MSACYIFSAMGFYPVCPGSDQFVIGTPYLPYMKINLGDNRFLTIKAEKVSDKHRYIKQVKLNGQPYNKAFINYKDIKNGGVLEFIMSSAPNKNRTFSQQQKPYSLTNDN
jgi:putative alpha-1,2-mannosidase